VVSQRDGGRERRHDERERGYGQEQSEQEQAPAHLPWFRFALESSPVVKIVRASGALDASVLDEAAACIRSGGTLIFPTDTVYGIGCAPENAAAVDAIFAAKRRPPIKPLAIHLARADQARDYACTIGVAARALIDAFWPGPLALVVERNPGVAAAAACGGDTISLRCPDDDACRSILTATGPLAATSANISSLPPFSGDERDIDALPPATLAVIAGPPKERRESTVLDCTSDTIRILRPGAIDAQTIAHALRGLAPAVRLER